MQQKEALVIVGVLVVGLLFLHTGAFSGFVIKGNALETRYYDEDNTQGTSDALDYSNKLTATMQAEPPHDGQMINPYDYDITDPHKARPKPQNAELLRTIKEEQKKSLIGASASVSAKQCSGVPEQFRPYIQC